MDHITCTDALLCEGKAKTHTRTRILTIEKQNWLPNFQGDEGQHSGKGGAPPPRPNETLVMYVYTRIIFSWATNTDYPPAICLTLQLLGP